MTCSSHEPWQIEQHYRILPSSHLRVVSGGPTWISRFAWQAPSPAESSLWPSDFRYRKGDVLTLESETTYEMYLRLDTAWRWFDVIIFFVFLCLLWLVRSRVESSPCDIVSGLKTFQILEHFRFRILRVRILNLYKLEKKTNLISIFKRLQSNH